MRDVLSATLEFDLSDEEALLKASVDRFCADLAGRSSDPRRAWSEAAELGLAAILVPEEAGGLGGGVETMSLLFEAIGRSLVDLPALPTAVVAATILSAASDAAGAELDALVAGERVLALAALEAQGRYNASDVRTKAAPGSDGAVVLTGAKIAVIDAPHADRFIVSAEGPEGPCLALVAADAPGLGLRAWSTLDGRAAGDLALEGVTGVKLLAGTTAEEVLNLALDRARLMHAAEILGLMEAAIQMTEEHLKTRQQFRQPLSAFQTLTHRMADMFVAAENARSMVLRGLSHLDHEFPLSRGGRVCNDGRCPRCRGVGHLAGDPASRRHRHGAGERRRRLLQAFSRHRPHVRRPPLPP